VLAWRTVGRAAAASLRGRPDPATWADAVAAFDALGVPFAAAEARGRQAEAVLASGGDRREAAALLASARHAALALGAALLVHELEGVAKRSRLSLAGVVADAPFGLSPRELEVVGLLSEGLTNRAIAERLFISEKTASVHVSNILAKVGVSTRGEAAAAARRAGIG
jgi:DNA-binding NarL/FixJ family response regulator